MMLQTYFVYIKLFLVLFAHGKQVNGQQQQQNVSLIMTIPHFVAIEEGKNVSIICRAISPITSCTFTIPGEINQVVLNENENRSDNYEYAGDGFQNGQCGITIYHIKKENNGRASCIVDLNPHLRNIKADIQITITKELPIDNKMRTIWGIIIFTVLTVLLNIFLLYCYMIGQKSAKKTKRALSQSHTNPAASNIIASERMPHTDVEKQTAASSSSSRN